MQVSFSGNVPENDIGRLETTVEGKFQLYADTGRLCFQMRVHEISSDDQNFFCRQENLAHTVYLVAIKIILRIVVVPWLHCSVKKVQTNIMSKPLQSYFEGGRGS